MKKLFKVLIPIGVLILCYFLFEPIFLYNFGRTEMSNLNDVQPKTLHTELLNKQADKILKAEFTKLKTPSLSIAIGMNDSLIWANSIGYSDIKNSIFASQQTKYRIGSISKTLTSIGLGVLLQTNVLKKNSKVKEFVPYVNEKLSNLTVEQLASHTSGIRNYSTCLCLPIWEFYDNDKYSSIKESISIFNNDKLLFEPGSDFSYSTYNYNLLSAMMEGATKTNFLEFMQNKVFDPLGLLRTVPGGITESDDNTAKFYDIENGKIKEAYKTSSSGKYAGGGFLSTPSDLVKFGNAVLNNKLIDTKTTETLFQPVILNNGHVNEQNYSLGWRNDISTNVFIDNREVRIVHHGGTSMGSTAMLILLPEYNVSLAVAMNRNGKSTELFDITYKIADLFLKDEKP
ncbi:serine hydrolase domain-containing protein [Cognatitamlana onchidii]|uniref:serine hydrolase domain-containing protein n=1 Tax=Cognatitamlana onchidii TaxID=2562860 RepID=UPI0010A65FDC|nr:serine hydrolase domain-containing protein [Algibacter onchidii]